MDEMGEDGKKQIQRIWSREVESLNCSAKQLKVAE